MRSWASDEAGVDVTENTKSMAVLNAEPQSSSLTYKVD
jgi:hypothetical protein